MCGNKVFNIVGDFGVYIIEWISGQLWSARIIRTRKIGHVLLAKEVKRKE
jgi:hypothetical protein